MPVYEKTICRDTRYMQYLASCIIYFYDIFVIAIK